MGPGGLVAGVGGVGFAGGAVGAVGAVGLDVDVAGLGVGGGLDVDGVGLGVAGFDVGAVGFGVGGLDFGVGAGLGLFGACFWLAFVLCWNALKFVASRRTVGAGGAAVFAPSGANGS